MKPDVNVSFLDTLAGIVTVGVWALWMIVAWPPAWASCAVWFKLQSFLYGGLKPGPMARSVDRLPLAGHKLNPHGAEAPLPLVKGEKGARGKGGARI